GVKSDAEFADEAMRIGITDTTNPWNPNRINEAKNGTKTREPGLHKRTLAIDYIAVLKSIASRNEIDLFTAHRIEMDTTIFLRSKACREKYATLNNAEMQRLFKNDAEKIVHT